MFLQNITIDTPEKVLFLIDNIVIAVCFSAIVLAVLIDFNEFHQRSGTKKQKKSIVETGTMFLFFSLFYLLVRFNVGEIEIRYNTAIMIVNILFLSLLVVGSYVNIAGRLKLGKNWSNQIKIYSDHTFVSKGVYSFVRHPLYASIIWMFLSASIIFLNYAAFVATLLVFIPFMYYRAKQEETLLASEFKNYKNYQMGVGMFFPKIKWHKN